MKPYRLLIALLGLALGGPLHAQTIPVDRIAAVVDDGVVLESQVQERMQSIRQRFAGSGQLPPAQALRQQIIERLILEELQLQMAERMGLRISDSQLMQAVSGIANSNGVTVEQFLAELELQAGSMSSVIYQLRTELTLQQLQQMRVSQRIFISDAEIDNFLNSSEGQFWTAPDYQLQHIMLPLSTTAPPEQVQAVQATVAEIQRRLSQGEDFGALALQYSESPTALEGGQLGWRKAGEFPPEVSQVVEATARGEVSRPVRSAGAIHLFKVNDIQSAESSALVEQARTRHILVAPNEIRSDEETRRLAEGIRTRLENGESFDELARNYSEDIANALRGGDLGWVMPGQMVPQFEQAMSNLQPGEIGGPVRTQFGWHVLRVDERRQVDMSNEFMRQQARNLLRSQRFEEELDLWLNELRSDAFIQILDQST